VIIGILVFIVVVAAPFVGIFGVLLKKDF